MAAESSNSGNNKCFIANQDVSITFVKDRCGCQFDRPGQGLLNCGKIEVVSNQDTSTPGFYKPYLVMPFTTYYIRIRGYVCSSSTEARIWIGDNRKLRLAFPEEATFPVKCAGKSGIVEYVYHNQFQTEIYIGALFTDVEIGDKMVIDTFEVFEGCYAERGATVVAVMAMYGSEAMQTLNLAALAAQTQPISVVLVVGKDSDRQYAIDRGLDYVDTRCFTLGAKWQAGLNKARMYNPEAVLFIHTDELLSPTWVEEALDRIRGAGPLMGQRSDIVASKLRYYVDDRNNRVFRVNYTIPNSQIPYVLGNGRFFSARLLDSPAVDWQVFTNTMTEALDRTTLTKYARMGARFSLMDDPDIFVVSLRDQEQPNNSAEHIMTDPGAALDTDRISGRGRGPVPSGEKYLATVEWCLSPIVGSPLNDIPTLFQEGDDAGVVNVLAASP